MEFTIQLWSLGINRNEILRGDIVGNGNALSVGRRRKPFILKGHLTVFQPEMFPFLLGFTYVQGPRVARKLGIKRMCMKQHQPEQVTLMPTGHGLTVGGNFPRSSDSGPAFPRAGGGSGISANMEPRYLHVSSHLLPPSCYFPRSNQIKAVLHLKCGGFGKIDFHTNFSLRSDLLTRNSFQFCIPSIRVGNS